MKALVYLGPEQLEIQEVPDPVASEDEVVVAVSDCGICGSDMHAYLGHDPRRPAPLILGHEASGVVESPGPWAGKRVTVNPLVTCGTCQDCTSGRENLCASRQIISMPPREGAFAEKIAIPTRNLVEVPAEVPLWQAALAEPIACGWHCVKRAMLTRPEASGPQRALVLGGGAIGVGAALSLSALGLSDEITIIEPNDLRRSRLEQDLPQFNWLATDTALDADFDIVIDAVGIEASRASASALAKPGGVIGHIGLGGGAAGLDIRRLTLQEIAFIGTYTYTHQDFVETANAIFDGSLGTFDWVDRQPLDQGAQAFKALRAGTVTAAKVVLGCS